MNIATRNIKIIILASVLIWMANEGVAQTDKLIIEDSLLHKTTYQIDPFEVPFFSYDPNRTSAPVTLIDGKVLQKTSSFDLRESLLGMIPNAVFMPVSNRPGAQKASMQIRASSYLILVDGVPRPIDEISPFEVASVNVLRGLSSTAMYGSDARNGIINFQTKNGNADSSFMDINIEYGLSTVIDRYLPGWLNSFEYANLYNEATINDGVSTFFYSEDALSYYQNRSAQLRYPDEDMYNQIFNKSMAYRRVNLSHGGGNESVNFFLNMTYQGEGENLYKIKSLTSNSIGIRTKLSVKVSDFLSLKAGVFGNLNILNTPNSEEQIWPVLSSYPSNAYPILIAPDTFGTSLNYPINPIGDLSNYLSTREYDLVGRFNTSLDFDFSKWISGLKASAFLAYDINTISSFAERPALTYALYEPVFSGESIYPDSLIQYGLNNPGAGISQTSTNYHNQFFNYVKIGYEKDIGRHRIITGVVNKLQTQKSYWKDARSQDLISQDMSFSMMYTFNNRYGLDYIMSYTGLMNLPQDKRFKMYPTIGASWIISEEPFMANVAFLELLKFRASYGTMGFYNSEDAFLYNTYWSEGSWTVFNNRFESSRQNYRGTYLIQLGNENIDRATQTEFNAGTDAILFSGRLSIGMDYYEIQREGMIMLSPIPSILGTRNYWDNIGAEQHRGFDLSLAFRNLSTETFSYSVGLNAGYNISEVLASNEVDFPYEWMKRVGNPADAIYGLVAEGLLSENDLNNEPIQTFGEVKQGNIKYKDLNDDGLVMSAIDEKMIGHYDPRISYSIHFNLSYKNFGLFILGYGLADYDVNIRNNPYYYAYGNNKYSEFVLNNSWSPENPNSEARHPRLTAGTNSNDNRNSSYWLVDGGFFSIQKLEFSYKIPETFLVKNDLADLTFFIRGKNLYSISKEKELDPANRNFGVLTYPSMRTFVLGLSLSF
ncbi:MAG: SusC/RagA family TonB-linked outer membrane protein [Bacteroidales bacterium]|nr:SusC/RagA family TonB-linked outer membrane protein [Bacteroidales bacterium]MCF8389565.1 SusC/RagA family TonB-linked outer membrane protein [Bacteroidales bacterium]